MRLHDTSHLGKCMHCVHGYKLCSWCVAHLGALVDTLLFFMMQQVARDAVMTTTVRATIATTTPTTMPSMLTGALVGGTVKEQQTKQSGSECGSKL